MRDGSEGAPAARAAGLWPWALLAILAAPAVWHVVDFPADPDAEYPGVARPHFSPLPPAAYRLAEPGDTLDRVALYLSVAAAVVALGGAIGRRRTAVEFGLWPAALGLALAGAWHASTPGPTFDGWHGLGFRAILDPAAPAPVRLAIAGLAAALAALVAVPVWLHRRDLGAAEADAAGALRLAAAAAILAGLRQAEIPGVEPAGYWPRWCLIWGLAAFLLAMLRSWPGWGVRRRAVRLAGLAAGVGVGAALVAGGIWLTWYHRPLNRLRTVEPGKIYISAMPTYRGLEVAQARHGFKTIINLFPEVGPLRSPLVPQEMRFVRERGIHYINSPGDPAQSDAFLDETLRLAQDPSAWPILVHCHGCMDRTPAWMGIYRFVVQGRPLDAILREIEQHRGYRPKASVTLLYNRVLAPRAPGRYAADPTAALLRRCAEGVRDPYYSMVGAPNPDDPPVSPGATASPDPRAGLTAPGRPIQYPLIPRPHPTATLP